MSWQEYVDVQLLSTGTLRHAAILGHAGDVWATSNGFNIDQAEIAKIIKGHDDFSILQTGGLTLNGMKYTFIRGDDKTLYMKKLTNGVFLRKTQQAIIVGVHDDQQVPEPAALTVAKLGDYLESVGY
ncbi:Profilin [Carpediemonas membranifera]|uniref:Profilin n=1 Tax=Carpediemonas membranifera TaxID=201153 RepID=A0A8J6E1G0_9EUKA|nr:Profilin [Carpediemonas membranifera]|eukprot:KAG9393428.1 Profilin [Carpediemonas membranifera]